MDWSLLGCGAGGPRHVRPRRSRAARPAQRGRAGGPGNGPIVRFARPVKAGLGR